jgi:hypothetical protein
VDKGALLMGQGIVRLYYRKSDLGLNVQKYMKTYIETMEA